MGSVNAHTHVYGALAPVGMPEPEPAPGTFLQILERVWWRLDRALDERSLRASARLYVAEALAAGTTLLVDHHESPNFIHGSLDVVAEACDAFGMCAVVCYGATERNGGIDEARRGLAECRRFIEADRYPGVRGVVGLHAGFTVSDETIRDAGALCAELGVPLHIHVAEDDVDVDEARRRGYQGPIERLDALDCLPPASILAHGIRITPAQAAIAADRGCWFVQNPRSNERNHVGWPAAIRGKPVALGTDGYPADMNEEASALYAIGERHGEAPDELHARVRAGAQLAAALGVDVPEAAPTFDGDLEEIRAHAAEEATRLWTRLQ